MAITSLYPRGYVSGINFEVVNGRVIKVMSDPSSANSEDASTIVDNQKPPRSRISINQGHNQTEAPRRSKSARPRNRLSSYPTNNREEKRSKRHDNTHKLLNEIEMDSELLKLKLAQRNSKRNNQRETTRKQAPGKQTRQANGSRQSKHLNKYGVRVSQPKNDRQKYQNQSPTPVLNSEEVIVNPDHLYFKDFNNQLYSMPKHSTTFSPTSNYPTVIENVKATYKNGGGLTPGQILTVENSFSDGESFLARHLDNDDEHYQTQNRDYNDIEYTAREAKHQIDSLKKEVKRLSKLLEKKMRKREKERNNEMKRLQKKRKKILSKEISKSLANLEEIKKLEKERAIEKRSKVKRKPHKTIIVLYPQYINSPPMATV